MTAEDDATRHGKATADEADGEAIAGRAAPGWSRVNLDEVENVAAKRDPSGSRDIRFPGRELGLVQTGLSRQALGPGARLPFGHRHSHAEEVMYVVSGSGRAKLDNEIVEIVAGDVLRLGPEVMRCFEAGAEGIEVLIFGQKVPGDESEIVHDWWQA